MSRLARLDDAIATVDELQYSFSDWYDAHTLYPVGRNSVREEYSWFQPWYGEEYDTNWDTAYGRM